jgi:hypothetical protein
MRRDSFSKHEHSMERKEPFILGMNHPTYDCGCMTRKFEKAFHIHPKMNAYQVSKRYSPRRGQLRGSKVLHSRHSKASKSSSQGRRLKKKLDRREQPRLINTSLHKPEGRKWRQHAQISDLDGAYLAGREARDVVIFEAGIGHCDFQWRVNVDARIHLPVCVEGRRNSWVGLLDTQVRLASRHAARCKIQDYESWLFFVFATVLKRFIACASIRMHFLAEGSHGMASTRGTLSWLCGIVYTPSRQLHAPAPRMNRRPSISMKKRADFGPHLLLQPGSRKNQRTNGQEVEIPQTRDSSRAKEIDAVRRGLRDSAASAFR